MSNRGYENIAGFYDCVIGNSDEEIRFVKGKIRKYFLSAKSVLELGCGTGNNLKKLENRFFTRGIDNSPAMLKIAATKTNKTEYLKRNIQEYRSDKKFDVVICLYDTINHLLKFSDWKKLFSNTYNNLNENGLFIFDINTLYKLELISFLSPVINKTGSNYFIADVERKSEHTYNWKLRIFEKKKKDIYRLYETDILESSFEIKKIKAELSKKFIVLQIQEQNLSKINHKAERVYFICRKK